MQGEEAAVQEIIHNRKIFVGGLTKESTEEKLSEYFSTYGMVSRSIAKLVFVTGLYIIM